MLYVRPATMEDMDKICEIYFSARDFMRSYGNVYQWTGDDLPGREKLTRDVELGQLFAICEEDVIHGCFAYIIGDDPTYQIIEDGAWLNDRPYGTIHRLASAGTAKGIACSAFEWAFAHEGLDLRCDTHEVNLPMQKKLADFGFKYCGIIYEPDGSTRLAYQKEK